MSKLRSHEEKVADAVGATSCEGFIVKGDFQSDFRAWTRPIGPNYLNISER